MIKQFLFNHFEVNCYAIVDEATRQCAIVDPAAEASYEDARLTQYIEDEGLTPIYILLTHAHVDHIAGLRAACRQYQLPVTMHPDGRKLLRQAAAYGSIMGFEVDNMSDIAVNEIGDNDILRIGETEVECRFVPGHCPGSMCYVLHNEKAVLTGDALFQLSIGRTDLPGGNYPTLIDHLQRRVMTLPDDYLVLPGHGPDSQIGQERKYNSFLV
ncbi:MAG: MBL fold metallo-hydrolase [Bacteroidales bacterium]|nr:MBL fold metallo-hydrolase [Bacteroidales bacterium]